ncbi:hypothetical protein [Spirillospora sp. NPDC048823]|uniref:hypothetical protein n=1 Tax=unclassified Spirillospora TaxID=2642701 RepID=UPI003715C4D1
MTGSTPQDRDALLITGIPPVVDSPPAAPRESPRATRPETRVQAKAVFVDATGWRARFGRRLGLGAGAVLIVVLGALGLGMTTGPSVPLTSWSEPSPDPGTPVMPPANPERNATSPEPTGPGAGGPGGGGQGTGASPSAPSAATPPAAPAPASTASPPGKGRSDASPPAWGRKKNDR